MPALKERTGQFFEGDRGVDAHQWLIRHPDVGQHNDGSRPPPASCFPGQDDDIGIPERLLGLVVAARFRVRAQDRGDNGVFDRTFVPAPSLLLVTGCRPTAHPERRVGCVDGPVEVLEDVVSQALPLVPGLVLAPLPLAARLRVRACLALAPCLVLNPRPVVVPGLALTLFPGPSFPAPSAAFGGRCGPWSGAMLGGRAVADGGRSRLVVSHRYTPWEIPNVAPGACTSP